jgi:hypothetical protein
LRGAVALLSRFGLSAELSSTTVAGGFLSLHVSGARADVCFGLEHPSARETIGVAFGYTSRHETTPAR